MTKHYLRVVRKGGLGFSEGEGRVGSEGAGEGEASEGLEDCRADGGSEREADTGDSGGREPPIDGSDGSSDDETPCAQGEVDALPRAMVVCRSRAHVVLFHQYMQRELAAAHAYPEARAVKIYAAFSGEVTVPRQLYDDVNPNGGAEGRNGERAAGGANGGASGGANGRTNGGASGGAGGAADDDVKSPAKRRRTSDSAPPGIDSDEYDECSGSSWGSGSSPTTGDVRVVTEASLNGRLRLAEAHLIIVCSKLDAGYNEVSQRGLDSAGHP